MFSTITSPSNPRVKSAAQLKDSRARRKESLFLIDGRRETARAWTSNYEFTTVFWNVGKDARAEERVDPLTALTRLGAPNDLAAELAALLDEIDATGVPVIPLSEPAFDKVRFGDRNEGIVAVARAKFSRLDDLDAILAARKESTGEEPLVAVVENIEKPGNLGAILRSADGAGVDALVVVSDLGCDVYNPNVVRASLGAVFHVPVAVADAENVLNWLRERKFQRATALCDESIEYHQLNYSLPTAIILGSEADGLTPPWSQETDVDRQYALLKKVRLPMLGVADSLNVSNAAAVLFYEARRSRLG